MSRIVLSIAAENALHRLQIHALARHARRVLILRIDLIEARGLAVGFGDRLLAIGLGLQPDARRRAFRFRHDAVGVGVGLVDRALLILLGRGHVAIGGQNLRGRVDRLQLNLLDEHAGVVIVEHFLHPVLHVRFDRLAIAGQNAVDRLEADDLAHDAFGDRFHGLFGMADVEDEILGLGRIDLPTHAELDVDDILIARQHQALFRRLGAAAAVFDARHPARRDSRLR